MKEIIKNVSYVVTCIVVALLTIFLPAVTVNLYDYVSLKESWYVTMVIASICIAVFTIIVVTKTIFKYELEDAAEKSDEPLSSEKQHQILGMTLISVIGMYLLVICFVIVGLYQVNGADSKVVSKSNVVQLYKSDSNVDVEVVDGLGQATITFKKGDYERELAISSDQLKIHGDESDKLEKVTKSTATIKESFVGIGEKLTKKTIYDVYYEKSADAKAVDSVYNDAAND